ncbi:TPA: hypothetical protein ACV5OQ_006600, partial [Pseudomonas aeruginosa]
ALACFIFRFLRRPHVCTKVLGSRWDVVSDLDALIPELAWNKTNSLSLLVDFDLQELFGHTLVEFAVHARNRAIGTDINLINWVIAEALLSFNVALDLQQLLAGPDVSGQVLRTQYVSRDGGIPFNSVAVVRVDLTQQVHHGEPQRLRDIRVQRGVESHELDDSILEVTRGAVLRNEGSKCHFPVNYLVMSPVA